MAAVLYWRLPALTPTDPGPLPWLPGIPRNAPCRSRLGRPTWQSDPNLSPTSPTRSKITSAKVTARQPGLQPGGHPTALIREIAVWRAANGINPQDPRPTGGGGQLDTAAALWKQRLDWHIARSTNSSGNETFNERQAAHTALSRSHHDSRRPYQTPGQRPNGPAAPGR